jgi:uncharacterized OB-fold protein
MLYPMDESDLADLRAQSFQQRRLSKSTCPECGQVAGGHFTGCPEQPEEEEDQPEE